MFETTRKPPNTDVLMTVSLCFFPNKFPDYLWKKHIERWAPIAKPSLQWSTWGTWASSVNYALVWAVVIAPSSLVTDYLIYPNIEWGIMGHVSMHN